jgi:choline dehydrogenase-like flavoprotein
MNNDVSADVVIIGAGAVGGMLAYQLAQSHVKVLLIEAGPRIDRGKALQRFNDAADKSPNAPYQSMPHAPHPMRSDDYYVQAGPDTFNGSYLRGVGGTSWHWTGFAARFRPNDFQMRTEYGVGVDWPIGYDQLVDHYETVEREWGVAGFSEFDHGAPRRTDFPMPGVPMSYSDLQIKHALRGLGWTVGPFIHARNSQVFDDRPPCCGSATCVPICPIGAKYDGSVHVLKAVAAGAILMADTVVDKIEVGQDRQISKINFRRANGEAGSATARIYILCTHAIETPKLLLISAQEDAPHGVANRSGTVGRYLLTQVDLDTRALAKEPLYPYRGPTTTGGIIEFRDGDFRRHYGAVGTSFMNRGWKFATGPMDTAAKLVGDGLRGSALTRALNERTQRELAINSSVETLPVRENQIVPDPTRLDSFGLPRPKIHFKIDDYTLRGLAEVRKRHDAIVAALQCTEVVTDPHSTANAIIAGTTRMGNDPADSVVDAYCRSHDHANLFIVGTGNFPTMPINAPTLTAVALGLRSLEKILPDLRAGRFQA